MFGGSVSFHLGQLAVLAGDFRAARRWLTHALDRHEQMRVMPFVARSHVAVGALELAAPDGSEARARRALEVAIALGRASGVAAPVREAEHALSSL